VLPILFPAKARPRAARISTRAERSFLQPENQLAGSGRSGMKEIADFLFQCNFLKKTPRTGYRFLGSGEESVAEHSFGVMAMGYVLSKLDPEADPLKLLGLCLFHDAVEARTGDQNYVYKRYVKVDHGKAVDHFTRDVEFGPDIAGLIEEYERGDTREARLAHDADQLDLLLVIKEKKDLGNSYAEDWIQNLLKRLQTAPGKKLARAILDADHTDWWFKGNEHWWVKEKKD
jgi:putative hydrolases of HD superfamily